MLTEKDKSDIGRMREEGMTIQAISNKFGVTTTTIYFKMHPKKDKERKKEYHQSDKCKAYMEEYKECHKEEKAIYNKTGLQGLRNKIRGCDWRNKQFQWLKRGLGDVHIHHEWIPETCKYTFSALVDAVEHRHRIINPIIFLEDNITELSEEIL